MADNAGRWTNEEHDRFLRGLDLYGKKWTKVAEVVGSRSTVQVRSHAQKYFQKMVKGGGPSEPIQERHHHDEVFGRPGGGIPRPYQRRRLDLHSIQGRTREGSDIVVPPPLIAFVPPGSTDIASGLYTYLSPENVPQSRIHHHHTSITFSEEEEAHSLVLPSSYRIHHPHQHHNQLLPPPQPPPQPPPLSTSSVVVDDDTVLTPNSEAPHRIEQTVDPYSDNQASSTYAAAAVAVETNDDTKLGASNGASRSTGDRGGPLADKTSDPYSFPAQPSPPPSSTTPWSVEFASGGVAPATQQQRNGIPEWFGKVKRRLRFVYVCIFISFECALANMRSDSFFRQCCCLHYCFHCCCFHCRCCCCTR